MTKATINYEKGERLVLDLCEQYPKRRGLYQFWNEEGAPQNKNIPEGMVRGSKEHALWLFFATLTDRRQVSEEVYKAHCAIYGEHRGLYSSRRLVSEYTKTMIEDILIRHRVGVPRQSATYWVVCRNTILNDFGGDPVHMYSSLGGTVEGILAFKHTEEKVRGYDPLPGYGPKISSLYALFLEELGLLSFPVDAFPVDVHVQRLFIQTGAITLHDVALNADLEQLIRPFLCEMIQKHSLDPIVVSHAFWFLGSKLCTLCYRRADAEVLCPAYNVCGGSANTKRYFMKGKWSPHDQLMRKGGEKVFRIAPACAAENGQQSLVFY